MKLLIIILMFCISCSSTIVLAATTNAKNGADNVTLVTQVYQDIFEKKESKLMGKYFAKNIVLYKDSEQPLYYNELKEHFQNIGQECIQLKVLPFEHIVSAGNQVVTLYTQTCTDSLNKVHKKRIMAITEINSHGKVTKIWAVTHEKKKADKKSDEGN